MNIARIFHNLLSANRSSSGTLKLRHFWHHLTKGEFLLSFYLYSSFDYVFFAVFVHGGAGCSRRKSDKANFNKINNMLEKMKKNEAK